MGRPAFAPTAKQRGLVEGYAACGTPEDDIARLLGIDPKTLRKHFRDELDMAHLKANAQVAQALYKTATDRAAGIKHVTAAIFWMKTRGRWKETTVVETTGKDGAPIETRNTTQVDLSALNLNDLAALEAIAERVVAGSGGAAPSN